jgi:hypothetical protein
MTWCEKDACNCYLPECAGHGCMDRTGPCDYCGNGKRTGLPSNACENYMNSGLCYPEKEYPLPGHDETMHGLASLAIRRAVGNVSIPQ